MDIEQQQAVAKGLAEGRPEAWETLYKAFFDRIWRYVARVMGSGKPEVSDVVQEIFMAAAKSARNANSHRQSLIGWLYGIARNQVALHYRRNGRHVELEGTDEYLRLSEWLVGRSPTPEQTLAAAELSETIRYALRQLWPGYAEILTLKYVDGWSADRIAGELNTTTESVRSKLARARQAFRETFTRLAESTRTIAKETSP